jgi:hypothetical protein
MKVLFNENFDYDMGNGKTMFCPALPEAYTVKRDVGEAAVAAGKGVEVDQNGKPVTKSPKQNKAANNGKTNQLAGDSEVVGSDSDTDSGAELLCVGDDDAGQ